MRSAASRISIHASPSVRTTRRWGPALTAGFGFSAATTLGFSGVIAGGGAGTGDAAAALLVFSCIGAGACAGCTATGAGRGGASRGAAFATLGVALLAGLAP